MNSKDQHSNYLGIDFESTMIKNRYQLITASVVAVVAIGYFYNKWKNQNERKNNYSKLKPDVEPDLFEKYRRSLQEMELDSLKEDDERNSEFERMMERKRMKREEEKMEFEGSEYEDKSSLNRKKRELEERSRNLLNQKKMEQSIKKEIADLKNEQLEIQRKRQLETIRSETRSSRELNQRRIAQFDDLFDENQLGIEVKNRKRNEEILEIKEKNEKKKQEKEKRLEKDLEEMRMKNQEKRREMDEQFIQIERGFQLKIWNEVIERNWSNRLNTLRSLNQDVKNAYSEMRRDPNQGTKRVLLAVEHQKMLMENEKNEMEKLYNENRKLFLLDIKDAIEDIIAECDRLSYVLNNEPSNTERINECVIALSRVSMEIPTLAELKQRYEERMK